ncbi:MAG: DEAD/DEAH box helicase family protein [Acidobacteria bacterium]|nr:DEAD/DEAH box helicase family protein [Acidobacteriota bacterium]
MDRLSMSLFDASVDLNPHQIEAALFALQSPLSEGVILADEVGLGKTIEAGIVLCQFWAERKRRLLVICPASLRKQWALELREKFNLSAEVLDAKAIKLARRDGKDPLSPTRVGIMSFNLASAIRDELKAIQWDLVVVDEAHKLRNAYRPSNKIGQGIRWATEGCRKLLLTATPLQNSLLELYGLSTLIDERLFGDKNSFQDQFTGIGGNVEALRQRLAGFCKRTLRNDVTEYIRYTERRALTRPFQPTDNEQGLYEAVSMFLQRPESYALPKRQRHLTALILRKLLASSSAAIAGTLDKIIARLDALKASDERQAFDFAEYLVEDEEMEEDLLDEILDAEVLEDSDEDEQESIDIHQLNEEIQTLRQLSTWAKSISVDTKTKALLTALDVGFEQMASIGGARKAVIFTESRRTQDYLRNYLESHGYGGKIVVFNGTNSGPDSTAIYESWVEKNRDSDRVSGSKAIDIRTALIEHFRDEGTLMLATEAAAEGINLQFCSLVINYDLPWNPQRIEQRIGRCHRYGQKHDVVVINFLNERNEADRRVLELLTEKFRLFDGVFGASDEVIGTIESGVDFEKRILAIYQNCRTSEEIDESFRQLQAELEDQIRSRLKETQQKLLDFFDEDVHERLKLKLEDARMRLDRFGKRFWELTRFILSNNATFDEDKLTFTVHTPPIPAFGKSTYHLITKTIADRVGMNGEDVHLYRLSNPLGQYVLNTSKELDTPLAEIEFDISGHRHRVAVVEELRGRSGWLTLNCLNVDSYEHEEYLLFSGHDDSGQSIHQETMEKMLGCNGRIVSDAELPAAVSARLAEDSDLHSKATIHQSLELNSKYFNDAREKLERWADDMVLSAEKALRDTKEQIKVLRRESRQATTLEEQAAVQEKLRKLERKQRKQRQEIFDAEDEIMDKRDKLVDQLQKRLAQKTSLEPLFTIRWRVV